MKNAIQSVEIPYFKLKTKVYSSNATNYIRVLLNNEFLEIRSDLKNGNMMMVDDDINENEVELDILSKSNESSNNKKIDEEEEEEEIEEELMRIKSKEQKKRKRFSDHENESNSINGGNNIHKRKKN